MQKSKIRKIEKIEKKIEKKIEEKIEKKIEKKTRFFFENDVLKFKTYRFLKRRQMAPSWVATIFKLYFFAHLVQCSRTHSFKRRSPIPEGK